MTSFVILAGAGNPLQRLAPGSFIFFAASPYFSATWALRLIVGRICSAYRGYLARSSSGRAGG
jgi:hypothetical protein